MSDMSFPFVLADDRRPSPGFRVRDGAAVRTADALGDLARPFRFEPHSLPREVDGGVEPLGVLDRPDLLADREVPRVEPERLPPGGGRILPTPGFQEHPAEPHLRRHEVPLHLPKRVSVTGVGTGTGIPAREKAPDGGDVIGIFDRESTELRPAHPPLFVDEHAVGHGLEAEEPRQLAVGVDDRPEAAVSGEGPRRAGVGVLDRDGNQLPLSPAMVRGEALPPGQLVAAASPRSPHEEHELRAPQVGEAQGPPVEEG